MKNLWSEQEARLFVGDLAQRVYTSRLLGRDKTLVMHGGGNTSVKINQKNIFDEDEAVLYVKGSGWDLETIEAAGFAPVRLAHLRKLAKLKVLTDPQMVNEMATHLLTSSAPAPSVETILHACIPFKYVDHTHSDAVLAVSDTADGEERIREIYGNDVVIVPYLMPGFDLAQYIAQEFPKRASEQTIGMVLSKHGIFSFGNTAKESYGRMIDLVSRAEVYLSKHIPVGKLLPTSTTSLVVDINKISSLRQSASKMAGFPMIVKACANSRTQMFSILPDLHKICSQGPITPDHVIRTKRIPMLGLDVNAYAVDYKAYFEKYEPLAKERKTILDLVPRVVIDSSFGMAVIGKTAKDAAIVQELYEHTIDVMLQANALGGYEALPAKDIFDLEYWDLEQAKLRKSGKSPAFAGEITLITGGASGIGRACVEAFLARGSAVVAIDIDPKISDLHSRPDYYGIVCDLTDSAQIEKAIDSAVGQFGGIDMLVLNAGMFPASSPISELASDDWRRVMNVNLDSNAYLMRACYPFLCTAMNGGRVVVVGSKNVPAPGPGAAAYSASKAALTQLARVAALEWGADGIRINILHPNAVFDTAIWSDEVLRQRASHYGMSVNEYKTNNLLKVEVTSRDVAELADEMCGSLFAKTTGAQLPVDGGNERVI